MDDNTTVETLQKIAENSNSLNDTLGSFFSYMKESAVKYGPDIWHTLLMAIQFSSIFYLIVGIISVGLLMYLIPAFGENVEKASKINDFSIYATKAIVQFFTGVVCLIMSLLTLLSVSNWLSAFSPETGLMYRLISKFL